MFKTLARSLLIVLVVGLVIVPVSSVFAIPPETVEDEWIITEYILVNCGDFDVIENAVFSFRETTFYDKDGNPVRLQGHGKYTGTLTNSVTGTTVTDAPDAQNWVVDFSTGLATVNGLQWRITVPGEGIVVLDAGTITYEPGVGAIIIHGPHMIEEGGLELLCDVLAGP